MHPSRPGRSQAIGLPANPRSRSASRPRAAPAQSEHAEPNDRRLRTQRSFASLPSTPRTSPPPLPRTRERYASDDAMSVMSGSSSSSNSSTSSSSWRRGRNGGYASSRTSIDDDDTRQIKHQIKPRQEFEQQSRRMADTSPQPPAADGGTLWNKVASAASSLTINVSKAWASNISVWPGEETPPGQESRLTKALKAYHIAKAKDTSELPDWLFEPHERGSQSRFRRLAVEEREEEKVVSSALSPPPQSRSRGLRDIYAAAAERRDQDREAVEIKPHDRLKTMRDAKRGIKTQTKTSGLPTRPGRQKLDAF